jgi:hypothetical protein
MMGTCPYCGNHLGYQYGQRFCNLCGNPLPVYGQAPAPYQPPPPVVYYVPPGPAPPPAPPPPPARAKKAFWKTVIVITAVLLVVFAVVLVAYELTRKPASPLEGSWNITGGEYNNETVEIGGTIRFSGDGSYYMTVTSPAPDTATGTWKDLGYGRMTIDGDSGFYELKGDALRFGVTMDSEGDSWAYSCTKA